MRIIFEDSGDRCTILHGDSARLGDVLPANFVDAIVCDPPAGVGFMGKGWDSDKGGRDEWIKWLAGLLAPAYRALKPGGHALFWALPRTSHWTATAVEDCGFEIRDVIMWLYGSGFPKSLDVSKAIDKSAGIWRGRAGAVTTEWQPSKGTEYERTAKGEPVTPEAMRWRGWGTALKPGAEHWILARKPLEGTVAQNVLKYGTGALNIDACRIGDEVRYNPPAANQPGGSSYMMGVHGMPQDAHGSVVGRWAANLVLDDEAGAMLDAQAEGVGASRFFYCAKPHKSETELGLDHLPMRSGGEATDREDGSAGLNSPRAGAGRNGGARNFHPTKKPVGLMRYLCKLVTPPGGIILDPFAGSGTTGVAALSEGFRFIGCELTDDYLPILLGRIAEALRA